jgi:CRP-like cAMP-binding protein
VTNTVEALEKTDLFRGISAEHLQRVAQLARRRHFDADSYIFREGDPGRSLFIIATGQVQIRRAASGRPDTVLELLEAGDSFGELALLDDEPRSASALAVADTEALVIDRHEFFELLREDSRFTLALLGSLAKIIRRNNDELESVNSDSAAKRLARALVREAEQYGTEHGKGKKIMRRVDDAELAGLAKMSIVELGRVKSDFEYRDIIRTDLDGMLVIPDLDRLRQVADPLL